MTILVWVLAYLLGSISAAVLLAKIEGRDDPRTQGSKNAGATNVLRNSGKKSAAIVVVIDILKAWIAVKLAVAFGVGPFGLGMAACLVVVGHVFPVFFQFKGGKGVACIVGAILGLNFFAGVLVIAVWVAVAYFSRYASLASLVAAAMGLIAVFFSNAAMSIGVLIAVLLIFWKHLGNIQRLKNGTEKKVTF